jgi:hypothetical protein
MEVLLHSTACLHGVVLNYDGKFILVIFCMCVHALRIQVLKKLPICGKVN